MKRKKRAPKTEPKKLEPTREELAAARRRYFEAQQGTTEKRA